MNEAIARLLKSAEAWERLREMTNAELADLLSQHVWAEMDVTSPHSDLVGVVIDRLRGLKTCDGCSGNGYVAGTRCATCEGTGDVRSGKLARAVLMFYDPGPWDAERARAWKELTGSDEATTRVLGDLARRGA